MGKAFLTSCRIFIRLCPEAFQDEATKVVWAMSYMNRGRASKWVSRMLDQEALLGQLQFQDWMDFEDEFKKNFTPINSEAGAVNVLEGTTYFQGNRSVDDYLDQFRDLIHDSGYTDPKTKVVKFRRGLSHGISTALASVIIGRPSDKDPEQWFQLAVQIDQNRAADEAFYASSPLTPIVAAQASYIPTSMSLEPPSIVPSTHLANSFQPTSDACSRCEAKPPTLDQTPVQPKKFHTQPKARLAVPLSSKNHFSVLAVDDIPGPLPI